MEKKLMPVKIIIPGFDKNLGVIMSDGETAELINFDRNGDVSKTSNPYVVTYFNQYCKSRNLIQKQ